MNTIRAQKRDDQRLPVSWEAECRLGGSSVEGTIRDVSVGGVFFAAQEPDSAMLDIDDIRRLLEPGDQVMLIYATSEFASTRSCVATVAWIGRSGDHSVNGVGLRFDD